MFTPGIDHIIDSARNRLEARKSAPGLGADQHGAWWELLKRCNEKIVPSGGNQPKWAFWITSCRGNIDAFGTHDDFEESGEVSSREDFNNLWLDYYPHELNWHQVTLLLDGSDLQIFFEQWFAIIDVDEGSLASNGQWGTEEMLDWILEKIQASVDSLVASPDKYNQDIFSNLPNYCRLGKIKRSILWDHQIGERFSSELGEQALSKLSKMIVAPTKSQETITVSDFLRFCEICYRANDYFSEGDNVLSAREKYLKMADNRHGGLLDLPEEDPVAFEKWFDSRERLGAHPWEICRGGNSTHISLFPSRTQANGWQLRLVGFSVSRALETAKMAIALCDARVPFELDRGKEMLRMLRGEDSVGVVPKHITPIYCHDLFPEGDIFFFINPWLDEQVADIVQKNAQWQEVSLLEVM